jgi:hypothetical protein
MVDIRLCILTPDKYVTTNSSLKESFSIDYSLARRFWGRLVVFCFWALNGHTHGHFIVIGTSEETSGDLLTCP